ncbi:DUF732 domain-containing protein [Microbispora amethystogenes]|uniref:DUF732 domain-containing protein n=1 Tax=Microbispora amethystogenes TaxID=1427754 RepID=UPI0033C7652D
MHPPGQQPQQWPPQQPYAPPPQQWGPPSPPRPQKKSSAKAVVIVVAAIVVMAVFGAIAQAVGGSSKSTGRPVAIQSSAVASAEPSPTSTRLTRAEREGIFVLTLRERDAFREAPSARLVKLGRTVCTALDKGATVSAVGTTLGQHISYEDAGYVIGAAVTGLCPRHKALVKSLT